MACCSAAAPADPEQKARGITPKADEILRKMADLSLSTKSFSADLTMVMNTQMQGAKQEMTTEYSLAAQRPNRFAMVLKKGLMGSTLVCDGAKLYTCLPMLKRYTESQAPAELSDVMTDSGSPGAMGGMAGGGAIIGALLAKDFRATILEGVTSAQYVGDEKLGDGDCQHLKFTRERFDWDLWVQAGKQPLVRKVTVDLAPAAGGRSGGKSAPKGLEEALKDMKMTVTLEFKNWSLNPDLPASRFAFVPPEGAKKSDSLLGGLAADSGEEAAPVQERPSPPKKPLPSGANAVTWDSYREQLRKWHAETLAANYRRCGHTNATWDAEVEKYYVLCAPVLAKQKKSDELIPSLADKAAHIAALGCDDPLFEYTRGLLAFQKGSNTQAAGSFQKSMSLLAASQYPKFYSFLAIRDLQAALERLGKDRESVALNNALYTAAAKAASDGDFGKGNQRYYCQECMLQECLKERTSCGYVSKVFFDAALKSFSASNSVDPWIAAVVRGAHHIFAAWDARGGGWASTVTDQGWKGFQTNLDLARTCLTEAHRLHPEYPEAATLMISVSMGSPEGAGEERAWFDRAVAAQLDYSPAYASLAWALRPRWGGSHEQMLALARECLATRRFDTLVPSIYFGIIKEIRSELEDWKEIYSWPGVYEDCVAATAGYLAAEKDKDPLRGYRSNMAIIAWASGHYADADKLLHELGDGLSPDSLAQFAVNSAAVIGETRVFTGPHARAITEAKALEEQTHYDEALKMFEDIAQDKSLDPGSRTFVEGRVANLRARAALESNEWVDVMPTKDMAGWQQKDGRWSVTTNGTLVGLTEGTGRIKVIWKMAPGENVEFTADVELGHAPAERATVLLAYGGTVDATGVGIRMTPDTLFLADGCIGVCEPVAKWRCANTNRLQMVLWDRKWTVRVNGAKLVDRRAIAEDHIGGPGLAFAEYYEGAGRHEVRIRNPRIRRLKEAPDGL